MVAWLVGLSGEMNAGRMGLRIGGSVGGGVVVVVPERVDGTVQTVKRWDLWPSSLGGGGA